MASLRVSLLHTWYPIWSYIAGYTMQEDLQEPVLSARVSPGAALPLWAIDPVCA